MLVPQQFPDAEIIVLVYPCF